MINNISFSGITTKRDFQKTEQPIISRQIDCDCFTCSKNQLDKSLEAARAKIIKELQGKNAEYGFTIGPNGEVLEENGGDEHHCTTNSHKVKPGSLLLHGHPAPLPLSSGDVAVLFATDAKSQEAVTREGKFSRLTKNEPFVDEKGYRQLYFELEKKLCLMALDAMGIEYKLNKHDIADIGRDYIEYQTMQDTKELSDDEIFKKLEQSGINPEDEPEITAQKLKERMYFQLLSNPHKYDKEHNTIIDNKEKINTFLSGTDGIEVRHKFLQEIADEYNLEYETDLFDD